MISKELVSYLASGKNSGETRELLLALLTAAELRELSNRLHIVRLLKKGIPQHEIAKKLGVGVATVTRGAAEIRKGRFKTIK